MKFQDLLEKTLVEKIEGYVHFPAYVSDIGSNESDADSFIVISRSIAVCLLTQMPTAIPVLHVTGIAIWGFTSYAMAGHLYYKALDHKGWGMEMLQESENFINVSEEKIIDNKEIL